MISKVVSNFNIYILPGLLLVLIISISTTYLSNYNYILIPILYILALYSIVMLIIDSYNNKVNILSLLIILKSIILVILLKYFLGVNILGNIFISYSGIFILNYVMILAFVFNVKGNLFVRLLNKYDYDIYNINKTQKVILYLCSIIFFTIFILSAYFKLYPQVVSAYYYNKYNSLHASNKSSEDAVSYLLKAISYNSKTEMKYHLELAHIYENNIAKNMDNSIIALEKIYNNMLSYSNKKDYIYTRIAKLYTYRDNIENYKHIYNIYNIDNKNKDVLSILINYGLVNKYYKILDISIVRDSYRQGFIKVNTIIDIAEQLTKDMEYSKSNKYYELAINLKYNKEKNIDTSLLIAIFNNLIYTGQYSKATLLYQMYIVDKSSQLTNIKDHEVELKVIRNKIGIYI